MLLTHDNPLADNTLVYLDGKMMKSYVAANDEEGWIDIVDIASMAPLDLTSQDLQSEELPTPFETLKTKRKFGKVEFKRLQKPQ